MNSTEDCLDACNSLLRGELSAVETYNQAIEKFTSEKELSALEGIKADHIEAVGILRQHITDMGGEPSKDSGAWGTFAKAVEGGAKILGESPALAALIAGEEHGISEYREALESSGVMEEIKVQIRSKLLPALNSHVDTLKRLKDA
ncbi:PA2169 family four-helix-bundle protein [Luteolibacter sp. GHJ8]|uniref:PA2169 family four-helix-bundle protein n=1 Tax=Luteolibacter rhizosphaerae TaxID=2989719 RepID=A0ABT3GB46_9BACT|nr:PA2169 family four-helix-bundle protein [Luteolibacter rhizosphaerae]MCW1917068.1 PA2169 family four-helix-bundle protein [Luteolibacter rhizosphaerae]